MGKGLLGLGKFVRFMLLSIVLICRIHEAGASRIYYSSDLGQNISKPGDYLKKVEFIRGIIMLRRQ